MMDKNVIVGAAGLEISLGYSGNLLNISQSGSSIDFALDEWSIEINGQLISIKTLDLRSVHENGTSAEFIYEGLNDLVIELRWTVHNSSGNVYALREVSVRMPGNFQVGFIKSHIRTSQLPTLASQIRTFSDAPFATLKRIGTISFLSGLQNPHVNVDIGEGTFSEYNAALTTESRFDASPQFFTIVKQSGAVVQPEPPKTRISVGEARYRGRFRNPSEALALDIAEINVLRSIVRDFLSPIDSKLRFVLYTYWLPLPRLPETKTDVRTWIEMIDDFADLGGDLLLTVPLVLPKVPDISPDSFWDLEPEGSVAAKIMNHARSRGLEIGYYMGVAADNLPFGNEPGLGLPIDGPFNWRKKTLLGDFGLENCLASDDYREWLSKVHANTIRRFNLTSWSWDPGPGDGRDCFSSEHGHIPGFGDHKGWLAGQKHIAELHREFPGLYIQGFYGQKEDGTWGLRGITQHEGYWEQQCEWGAGIYPELSSERLNANGVRQQAWWSQNFRFAPAELNHALFGRMSQMCLDPIELGRTFDHWGWRFGLLSALAVGGSPTAATIPTRDEPEWVRSEFAQWVEWAKSNAAPLEVDIAGGSQVRIGGLDWYLRSTATGSWLFIANPAPRAARAEINLTHYPAKERIVGRRLRRLHPAPGEVFNFVGDSSVVPDSAIFEIEVPPYEVIVLQVEELDSNTQVEAKQRALESVPVALDSWINKKDGKAFQFPNDEEIESTTLVYELPKDLFQAVNLQKDKAGELRAKHPMFPDTFAYIDPERLTLMIPILDADAASSIQVFIDDIPVDTKLFGFQQNQMKRFAALEEVDISLWTETGVVWWCDLTEALTPSAKKLSIEVSALPAEHFLGPLLQVPSRIANLFAGQSVTYSKELGPDHTLNTSNLESHGPRILDAWVTPSSIHSHLEFTVTAQVANAEQVFVSLHVGGGNFFDRKLTRVSGSADLWSVTSRMRDRTSMILSPRNFILWCEDSTHRRSVDFAVKASWVADLLSEY